MERKGLTLTVCLYLTNPTKFDIPVTQIAGGHVFGPYQRLKLVLQGHDNDAMMEIVSNIQDCCFPLVEDISTTASPNYDVIVVLLPTVPRNNNVLAYRDGQLAVTYKERDSKKTLVHSAVLLGNVLANSVNETTRVLIIGDDSNLVASLLSQPLGGLCGNRLLAFQPESSQRSKGQSQYKMANILCQTISDWWAGVKKLPSNMKAGIKFFENSPAQTNIKTGIFLSVPVEVNRKASFKVCPNFNLDKEVTSGDIQKLKEAFKEMRALINGGFHDTSSLNVMSCL